MMTPPEGFRKPPVALIIATVLIISLIAVTVYAGFTVLQLGDAATEQAKDINTLYQVTLWISLVVFLGVSCGIIYALFRFRRVDDEIPEQIHGSSVLEFTWTIIPIIILIGLFVPSLILVVDLKTPAEAQDTDVVVEAIGHQWWWEFNFPDEDLRLFQLPPSYQLEGIPLGNEAYEPPVIVLPVGKTITFRVSSMDVVHSFFVQEFLFKMQAVPGTVNEFSVKIDKEGVFSGHCVQFCGLRHSDMLFLIDARSPEEYRKWVEETKAEQQSSSPAAVAAR